MNENAEPLLQQPPSTTINHHQPPSSKWLQIMSYLFLIVGRNDNPLYETGAYSQKVYTLIQYARFDQHY
jgi:hypothetical protein